MSDILMRNYMEECVKEMLPKVIKDMTICKCEQCKLDIMAYALNQLPTMYVVSRKGIIYAKLDEMASQFGANIISAIGKAAELVGDNPRHE